MLPDKFKSYSGKADTKSTRAMDMTLDEFKILAKREKIYYISLSDAIDFASRHWKCNIKQVRRYVLRKDKLGYIEFNDVLEFAFETEEELIMFKLKYL